MNRFYYEIVEDVNEGIIILDNDFTIVFWNNFMERITGLPKNKAMNQCIYTALEGFNKHFIRKSLEDTLKNGHKMFYSAGMHKELVHIGYDLNVKMSRFKKYKDSFVLIEFIDVTNQFLQINRLKNCINELCLVNKQLKEKEKIIRNLAYYDSLTGVANRVLFYQQAEKFLEEAKKNQNKLGILFIDVDKFKNINDTYGHLAGDNILIEVANILTDAVGEKDMVARHGGDEFLILLPDFKDSSYYTRLVSKIRNNKNRNIRCNGEKLDISFSIGISVYPDDGDSIDKLIAEADKAMYAVKTGETDLISV